MRRHLWTIGAATGTGILGLAVTSGLALLAHHFVDELSRPHKVLENDDFGWELPRLSTEPPPSVQRALTFKTLDGKLLCGDFWAQPHPAPTVVICHGYRVSRVYLRPVAALEYAFGFNVLIFDFRGHGESESVATSGGNAEIRDLEAALAAASKQPETLPGKIIIHGFSMGASVALLTPPHPDVVAIIADSPYARLDAILRRLVHYRLATESTSWTPVFHQLRRIFPTVAWATVAISRLVFRLRFGHALVARPDSSFKRWKAKAKAALNHRHIPILLIHAAGDELIPITHAHQIVAGARAYNVPLETYFVDHPVHCGAYGYNPQQYINILLQFLSQHLGNDFPQQRAV